MKKNLKIAVIGGGSSYTPELVEGIIKRIETLPVGNLVLIDVEAGLDKVVTNTDLVKRMFKKAGLDTSISYTLNRREGLKNADFVMAQLRVGGLSARALDEEIPLKYGMVGQETTGIGGFFKALRTIPVMMDICKDMEDVCKDAWLINFTNPSGIVTQAILNHTKVKCIGLCNVPINMHYDAAKRLGVKPDEIKSNFIGLNHLSFMNHCFYNGVDVLDKVLNVTQENSSVENIVKLEDMDFVAQKLGLMLSPYMQYFYFEKEMISKELNEIKTGQGTRANQVMKVESDLFNLYQDKSLDHKPEALSKRGGARYSQAAISLIHSIYNNSGDNQVVNTLNNGSIEDLADNVSVEVNCIINEKGAIPIKNGRLPKQVAGLIHLVKSYEDYTIEAALTGDRDIALLALLNNPLVHSAKDVLLAFEELQEAHKLYLPKFER